MQPLVDLILDSFSGEDIQVFTRKDAGCETFSEDERMIVFKNQLQSCEDLYIFVLSRKITIVFGSFSCHLSRSEKDIQLLLDMVRIILSNQAPVLTLFGKSYSISVLSYKNLLFFSGDAAGKVSSTINNQEFLITALQGGLQLDTLYWEGHGA